MSTRNLALVVLILAIVPVAATMAAKKDVEHEWRLAKDPYYGDALYYYSRQQYFSAITRLRAGERMGRLGEHKDEAELLLGGMYLSYGMHNKAEDIFNRLLTKEVKPEIRDRANFYMGKIRYQRGFLDEAYTALGKVGDALPLRLRDQHKVLLANMQMLKGNYEQATKVLGRLEDDTPWSAYGRYNLGVALIRLNRPDEGVDLLEEVGDMKAEDDEMASLRDKANTALGYNFIKQNKPGKALDHLGKVRLDGLLANKALLGTGWAYAAKEDYRKALVYWTELQKRSILDSAVQESLLAIPYSLGNLGAFEQALKHYREAIAIYEAEQQRLGFAVEAIRAGKLTDNLYNLDPTHEKGWFYALNELPDTPESRYLIQLMAGHKFQEALKNYRDVRFLHEYLGEAERNISAYDWMVAARREGYRYRLTSVLKKFQKIDSGELQRQRDSLVAEIRRIESEGDLWSLASASEKKTLQRLDKLEKKINRAGSSPEVTKLKNRLRLLKGVVAWNIQTEYIKRAWKVRAELKELDKALEDTRKARTSVETARLKAPAAFDGFDRRLQQYRGAIKTQRASAAALTRDLSRHIENLAIAGLQEQRARISTYLAQARFGIAQILDKSSQGTQ